MAEADSRDRKRLKLKDFKLDALLEITHAINARIEVDALLALYRRVLETDLSIEKLILYHLETTWKPTLYFGVKGSPPDIQPEDEAQLFSGGSFNVTSRGKRESFDIAIPVMNDGKPFACVLVGDLEEKRGTSPVIKHMKFIQTITNIILVAIRNRKLEEDKLRQERIRKELELAAEMQSMLVPSSLPSNDMYDVSAVYKPHIEVGGDYYDFFELPDGRMLFCMADVSGKGLSAAFLMSNFQASLNALFRYVNPPLQEAVNLLNERVLTSAMGEKYITLFIAVFDRATRRLRYINCGHPPPVLVHPNGQSELLTLGSIGVGMWDVIPRIQEGELTLDPGSLVMCYTDGLIEQENENDEAFGEHRLAELGRQFVLSGEANVDVLNADILRAFDRFRGTRGYIDDTALLSCRFL